MSYMCTYLFHIMLCIFSKYQKKMHIASESLTRNLFESINLSGELYLIEYLEKLLDLCR